ncbi:metallophosphoesterase family protein [Brevundimonas sp.]|uniref:metallophosphoesterase family protein n=1 Tax=Brevundimonas sp. TaxID=1871086 RepID=UPI001D438F01|nr:metallophosphoesterase family protein [Brevundimonas sp.]MBA4000334.1 YfcE family phosphodiesterase [Brevundimonas sp.]
MTRIAVLSDIHGNLAALDAVLADAERRGFDSMVNLGDICSGGLYPSETADRLMALNLPTIRGNHERQVLTSSTEHMGASDRHARASLRADQLAWLAQLPEALRLEDGILMVHGTPRSDVEYFLHTVEETGLRPATVDEVRERAAATRAAVIVCGHTHLPGLFQLDDGPFIINPGSVGLPAYDDDRPHPHVVEAGSPHARYAMLEARGSDWTVDLIAVPYDWEGAARTAEANGRPDWARALRTGRVR